MLDSLSVKKNKTKQKETIRVLSLTKLHYYNKVYFFFHYLALYSPCCPDWKRLLGSPGLYSMVRGLRSAGANCESTHLECVCKECVRVWVHIPVMI